MIFSIRGVGKGWVFFGRWRWVSLLLNATKNDASWCLNSPEKNHKAGWPNMRLWEKVFVTPFWTSPFFGIYVILFGGVFPGYDHFIMTVTFWLDLNQIFGAAEFRNRVPGGSFHGIAQTVVIVRGNPLISGKSRLVARFMRGFVYELQGHLVDISSSWNMWCFQKKPLVIWHVCFQEVDEFEEATESIRFKTSTFNETLR